MTRITILSLVIIFFVCCNQENAKNEFDNNKQEYAKSFKIQKYKDYVKITVLNPWQNAVNEQFDYFLVKKDGQKKPKINGKIISVPVKRVVCLSTTHLGFIEALNEQKSVVGLSGVNFVFDTLMNLCIDNGLVSEVGYEQNIDVEKIVKLQPDVVFAYDISGNLKQKYEQIEKLGIPVVYVAEYLENEPLGRSEWLKFFAAFYDKDSLGSTIFSTIKTNYENNKHQISQKSSKIGVVANIPFNGVWYVPGGKSYFATLIADAGGNYLWSKNIQIESFVVSMETVFGQNDSIDVLLNPSMCNSIADVIKNDNRLNILKCVTNRQVFNNNKRISTGGGNDFWESGTLRSDLILEDLVKIFDYQLNNNENEEKNNNVKSKKQFDKKLFYYQKLN